MVESFLEFIRGGEGRVIGEEAALSGGFEEFSFLGEGSDVVEGGEGLGVVSLGCEGERVGGDGDGGWGLGRGVLGAIEDVEGADNDSFLKVGVGEVGTYKGLVVVVPSEVVDGVVVSDDGSFGVVDAHRGGGKLADLGVVLDGDFSIVVANAVGSLCWKGWEFLEGLEVFFREGGFKGGDVGFEGFFLCGGVLLEFLLKGVGDLAVLFRIVTRFLLEEGSKGLDGGLLEGRGGLLEGG